MVQQAADGSNNAQKWIIEKNSDGTFTISVLYADTDNMLIDILITEEYSYGFMNQKGKTSCERTIRFKN